MKKLKSTTGVAPLGAELENPILDIAASFWEEERYQAFRLCYASMRRMDDLVDDLRTSGKLENSALKRKAELQLLAELAKLGSDSELGQTIEVFRIPPECWRRLAGAMQYDLSGKRFPTFLSFRRYAEGAAVAPAAVFIHLIALQKGSRSFTPAPVDVFASARSMALFSYLTHIIRDFRRDYAEGLEYIPLNLRARYSVGDSDWAAAGAGGQTASFTSMVKEIHRLANEYRRRSIPNSLPVYGHLDERYKFSLWIIWELYSQILERIESASFILDPALVTPGRGEIVSRVTQIARKQGICEQTLREGFERLGVAPDEWM